MDVFTWSSKIDELQPQKWGNIYREYLQNGFSLEQAYSKLYTSINNICQDFGISPKDNNIGINWPKKITYISEKDNYAKKLESHSNLPVFKS